VESSREQHTLLWLGFLSLVSRAQCRHEILVDFFLISPVALSLLARAYTIATCVELPNSPLPGGCLVLQLSQRPARLLPNGLELYLISTPLVWLLGVVRVW
jgi:hypothetical protein